MNTWHLSKNVSAQRVILDYRVKYVLYVFIDKINFLQIIIFNIRAVLALRVVDCFICFYLTFIAYLY